MEARYNLFKYNGLIDFIENHSKIIETYNNRLSSQITGFNLLKCLFDNMIHISREANNEWEPYARYTYKKSISYKDMWKKDKKMIVNLLLKYATTEDIVRYLIQQDEYQKYIIDVKGKQIKLYEV